MKPIMCALFRNLLCMAVALAATAPVSSCTGKQVPATMAQTDDIAPAMTFNADSAYNAVERQVLFGPRVPGTAAHRECGDYLEASLRERGADTVIVQNTRVTAFNGNSYPVRNILGRYKSQAADRVLLLAHWDSRPWADAEEDESLHSKPVPGANDGASGVGVLLEIARLLCERSPEVGVDILFVDAEDLGESGSGSAESWALGTQEWVKQMPYPAGRLPRYAVLLDMVGGVNARFHREPISDRYARAVVNKVWATAEAAGYSDRFVNRTGSPVVDDHLFLIGAGIPAIDIIEAVNAETGTFPPAWHTLSDDMRYIDRSTLKAVGQTVTNLIYNEKP